MTTNQITLIHPSYGRPKLAEETYYEWMNNAAAPHNIEYIMSVDRSDPEFNNYYNLRPGQRQRWRFGLRINDSTTAIKAINNAAGDASGDLLIVVSDDFSCPKNWDVDLLRHIGERRDFAVKTWDGLQPWIITLPIMDREYYNRFGYIYYPEYEHMFCDTEMTHVADLLDKVLLVNMEFPHRHYSQPGGIAKDAVSVKNDITWAQGEVLYLHRMGCNFDLPESEIKGVLRCDKSHLNWLRNKGVKIELV